MSKSDFDTIRKLKLNGLVQEGHKWLFQLKVFFLQKCLNFCICFQLRSKRMPCIFLAGLHFISEKNEDKILNGAQWTQQSRTRAFKPKKDTGECFSTKINWRAHAQIQALLKEKKFYPKKSLASLLHQAIQLAGFNFSPFLNTPHTLACFHLDGTWPIST